VPTMHSTLFSLSYSQVTATILLAIIPLISATLPPTQTYPSPKGLNFRANSAPNLPAGWSSLGCYTDNPAQRALTSSGSSDPTGMTTEECVGICSNPSPHVYAGLENGTDCYCGNVLTPGSVQTSPSNCASPCVADSNEICGGDSYLSLYWNGAPPGPQPTIVKSVPSAESWETAGCWSDNVDARTLTTEVSVEGGQYGLTVEKCVDQCINYGFIGAGLELGQQCWCGNSTNGGHEIDDSSCMMACSGDSTQNCGGPNALVFYYLDGN